MTAPPVSNEDFLRALFGDEWENAHVTAFHGDPNDGGETKSQQDRARWRWIGNHAGRILRSFRPGENQYYVVSLFHEDYADRAAGRATRRKAMFKSMALVVVDDVTQEDLGDGKKVSASTVLAKWGEPSFRLMTSPGNEQWGYLFDEPLTDRLLAETLVHEMIARGLTADGKDPGMSGVTRYVRLPGGTNRKAKYGAEGFRSRLNTWNPERRFPPRELATRWGFDLDAVAETMRTPERTQAPSREPPGEWRMEWANLLNDSDHEHAARFRAEDMAWDGAHGSAEEDPLVLGLAMLRLIKERRGPGQFEITCPFLHEHTKHADTGTARMPNGGIACHHGHCVGRKRSEYAEEVAARLKRLRSPRAQELARALSPWKPAPYDPKKLRDPEDALTRATDRLTAGLPGAGAATRSLIAREALFLAPYVAERRMPEMLCVEQVAIVVERHGAARSLWHEAWKWARTVIHRKEAV